MSGLASFLLARVDEDAARARAEMAQSRGTVGVSTLAQQLLAECEEKRRIVERFLAVRQLWLETRVTELHIGQQHLEQARRGGEMDGLWRAMTHLAHVYADHEDYQPEWRPAER